MKTVNKYQFKIAEHQQLDLPRGAEPLHAGLDPFANPCLWCLVESEHFTTPIDLYVVKTGDRVPVEAINYIGSFTWKINNTDWHVFTG